MSSSAFELKSMIVRAGAGAGKTTDLIKEVLGRAKRFYSEHGRWPKFVVSTFTIKATHELRERFLVESLAREHLLEFSQSRSLLLIGTLHSIFAGILRDVGHLFNLDRNFAIIDQSVAWEIKNSLLIKLIKVDQDGAQLWRLFGHKRMLELLDRWEVHFRENPDTRPLSLAAIETLATKRLAQCWSKAHEALLQFKSNCREADFSESRSEFFLYFERAFAHAPNPELAVNFLSDHPTFRLGKKDSEAAKDWAKEFSSALKELKELMAYPNFDKKAWKHSTETYAAFFRFAHKFSTEFRDSKLAENQLEFSDLENLLYEAMLKEPRVFAELSESYDGWFIDEFQDTNQIQNQILNGIVGEKPIYMVGDPQQSIYNFRGANSEHFLRKVREFTEGKGEVKSLQVNYRSDPGLLKFFNDYFASFSTSGFVPQEPKASPDVDAKVAAKFIYHADVKEAQAPAIERIRELCAAGVPLNRITVLARTNSELKELARSLKQLGLPCSLLSGDNYFERQEIKDVRAFVLFLLNPWDNKNLIQVLRSPWFYVNDDALIALCRGRPLRLWEQILITPLTNPIDQLSVERLKHLAEQARYGGVKAAVELFLHESGFLESSQVFDQIGQFESAVFRFLGELNERLKNGSMDLIKWLRSPSSGEASTEHSADIVPSLTGNSIGLMTIHASKGLAFEHVIVLGCGRRPRLSNSWKMGVIKMQGDFALWIPADEDGEKRKYFFEQDHVDALNELELSEGDRLHYVALTRAISSVSLIWSGKIEPSSFLDRSGWPIAIGEHVGSGYGYSVVESHSSLAEILASGHVGDVTTYTAEEFTPQNKIYDLPPRSAPITRATLERMLTGSRVHAWLENYNNNQSPSQRFEALEWLLKLNSPPMQALLNSGHREWRMSYKDGESQSIVSKQIDLWGEDSGVIYIIDYKTGSSKFMDSINLQLNEYKTALAKMFPKKPIKAYALFLSEKKVIEASMP